MASNDDTPEARALQEHYATLVNAIQDPNMLGDELFAKRILSREVLMDLQTPGLSNADKNRKILSCVYNHLVFVDPSKLWVFTDVLSHEAYAVDLSKMLETSYWKHRGDMMTTTSVAAVPSLYQQPTIIDPLPTLSLPPTKKMRRDEHHMRGKHRGDMMTTTSVAAVPSLYQQPTIIDPLPTLSLPPTKRMRRDEDHMRGNPLTVLAETVRAVYRNQPEVKEDCWPPVKKTRYINLAMIEDEPIDYKSPLAWYTLRGSVDDIIKGKKEIAYLRVFEDAKPGSRILLEGRPGSGKTTLMNKISRDWANKKILNSPISVLILVRLRHLSSEIAVTLHTIISFFSPADKVDELVQEIQESDGEGVCFALDGLDEYSKVNAKVHSDFIIELIRGNKLPKAIVIVASRPAASHKFRCDAAQSIEVLGFLKPQIEEFVSDYYKEDERKAQALKRYLDDHPNVMHMCYLPINAAIVTFLFGIMHSNLPETETEIYYEFTRQTLIRTLRRSETEVDAVATLKQIEDLNPEKRQMFLNICKLALVATEEKKQGFVHEEVKDFFPLNPASGNKKSLGLITVDHQVMRHGSENTYSFLHLTFQEFLAAYYLNGLNVKERCLRVSSYHKKAHMNVVCKFLCGLSKLNSEKDLEYFQSIISGVPPCTLFQLHCTYESQSEVACQTLVSASNGVLCLKKETVNASDCIAVGFVVTNSGEKLQELSLESCHIGPEGLETLARLDLGNLRILSLSGTKLNDKDTGAALGTCLVKAKNLAVLKITKCGLQLKTFNKIAPSLPMLTQLETLSLQHNSLGIQAGKSLADGLKGLLCLKELDVDGQVLTQFGPLQRLFKECKSMETVRLWRKLLVAEVSVNSLDEAVMRLSGDVLRDRSETVLMLELTSKFENLCIKRLISEDESTTVDSWESHKSIRLDKVESSVLVHLPQLIKAFSDVKVLSLSGNHIGAERCAAVSRGLQECRELQELDTNSVVISCGGGILHLLESIPALETIRCSSTGVDLEVSREFAKGTTVSIFKGKKRELHLTHTSDTYDLDLRYSHLQAADAHVIAEVFKLCPRVQKIDLSGNTFSGEGCAALSRGLKECRELKELRLGYCSIGDSGATALAECLRSCINLQHLDLSGNTFGGEGCAALSRGLKECRELQQLHLMSCSIDDSGATALAECLRSCINLQHLDLRHNSLTDASVQSISELITKVKSLETLRLQGNSFTDASIKSISELFTTVKSLKTLDLGGTISLKEGEPN